MVLPEVWSMLRIGRMPAVYWRDGLQSTLPGSQLLWLGELGYRQDRQDRLLGEGGVRTTSNTNRVQKFTRGNKEEQKRKKQILQILTRNILINITIKMRKQ